MHVLDTAPSTQYNLHMRIIPDFKICSRCGENKSSGYFSKCARMSSGLQSRCKQCDNEVRKVWYEKHREQVLEKMKQRDQSAYRKQVQAIDPDRYKFYDMKSKYGVTKEQYTLLFEFQDGLCAICKKEDALVVDHCHKTKRVRGLLCYSCNVGLGFFRDSPEFMRAAIHYLETS